MSGTHPLALSGPQEGPVERGHINTKSSRSVKINANFDSFRAEQKESKIAKECQTNLFNTFDDFRLNVRETFLIR